MKRKASSSSLGAGEAQAARPSKKPKNEAKSGSKTDALTLGVKEESFDETAQPPQALLCSASNEANPLVVEPIQEAKAEELELVADEELTRLAGLNDLPVEVSQTNMTSSHSDDELKSGSHFPSQLLIEIHELSGSATLPLVSRYTHACLSNPTTRQAVRWIERKYPEAFDAIGGSITGLLTRCLRRPICTLPVVRALEMLWVERMGCQPGSRIDAPENLRRPMPPLRVSVRVFRGLVPTDPDVNRQPRPSDDTRIVLPDPHALPLVEHLLCYYKLDGKSLARGLRYAVFAGNIELAKDFIKHGASIHSDDRYEVEVAARRKDLDMFKALLETTPDARSGSNKIIPLLTQSDLDKIAKWASREMLQYLEERWGMRPSLKSILSL
jgi:hypothetical protein